MTGYREIMRRFGDRVRERLSKLFRQLGTDNVHEAEAARSRIDALLRDFGRVWADLIELLGGTAAAIRADLARDIAALGSSDPDERVNARRPYRRSAGTPSQELERSGRRAVLALARGVGV